jgi:monoamine oxidase
LGAMEKIGIRLVKPVELPEYSVALDVMERGETHVLHMSEDRMCATVLVTGDCARGLSAEGSYAAIAFGRAILTRIAGSGVQTAAALTTGWLKDPWAAGSYSHCVIGHAQARSEYSEPVEERLFFAGEAGAGGQALTAGGAYICGAAAAEAAAESV